MQINSRTCLKNKTINNTIHFEDSMKTEDIHTKNAKQLMFEVKN